MVALAIAVLIDKALAPAFAPLIFSPLPVVANTVLILIHESNAPAPAKPFSNPSLFGMIADSVLVRVSEGSGRSGLNRSIRLRALFLSGSDRLLAQGKHAPCQEANHENCSFHFVLIG